MGILALKYPFPFPLTHYTISFLLLCYNPFRWGSHLNMSLFHSIHPPVHPSLTHHISGNGTLCDHGVSLYYDISRCFSSFFFKKCNIVNKIILFFIGPLQLFFFNICFSSSSVNAKKKFWGVPYLRPHVCDFLFSLLLEKLNNS